MHVILLSLVVAVAACGSVSAENPDAAESSDGSVGGDASSARAMTDRPDEVMGHQVHVMYVVPSDGLDRGLDTSGALAVSVDAWSQWISRKSQGPRLRLDTSGGKPDITFVRLARTNAALAATGPQIRDEIERDLGLAGLIDANKVYAVYYDGDATTCGGAPVPPGLVGRVSALYLDGHVPAALPCRDNPLAGNASTVGYFELSMIRGLLHTLGAVPSCAPNRVGSDVGDSATDIMYSGSAPWAPSEIDVGRNDYWGHGRADCVDLARSSFLDPLPANSQLPPGW